MLATRLIEARVRFVTVLLEGWDTHLDNFNTLGRELLPKLRSKFFGDARLLGRAGIVGAH